MQNISEYKTTDSKKLLMVISGKSNPTPEIISNGKATYIASTYVTFCKWIELSFFSYRERMLFAPEHSP